MTSNLSSISLSQSLFSDSASIEKIFAWLRPVSPISRQAYDSAVNTVLQDPIIYAHERQFFHTDPVKSTEAASIFTDEGASGTSDDCSQEKPLWTGAYSFSLDRLPRCSHAWALGTGNKLAIGEGIDLMLASPSRPWTKSIAGNHAYIYLHKESARMMLEARHTIKLSGTAEGDVMSETATRALESGDLVSIGDCAYVFEYTKVFESEQFSDELSKYMKRHHGPGWALPVMLSSSAGRDKIILGDYTCTPGAFAKGSFGEVAAGWAKNGRAVAIKKFKTPDEQSLKAHRDLMAYIGNHSSLLVDYLKGITYLHDEKRTMHRDINPNNLGVISFEPPRGVILDLDSATRKRESDDHTQGTIPYVAPEIMELKRQGSGLPTAAARPGSWPGFLPYGNEVDVWALGLSLFSLHIGQYFNWGSYGFQMAGKRTYPAPNYVTLESYRIFKGRLEAKQSMADDSLATQKILTLVDRMVDWHAAGRMRAKKALDSAKEVVADQKAA